MLLDIPPRQTMMHYPTEVGQLNQTATSTEPLELVLDDERPTSPSPRDLPDALDRACLAAKIAAENKGENVVVLDLTAITPIFDYFVIATGNSRRLVHTIVEEIDTALTRLGDERMSVTGYETSKWVVQDYGDVMCHVFDPETRSYYNLEDLWADAERIDWEAELD